MRDNKDLYKKSEVYEETDMVQLLNVHALADDQLDLKYKRDTIQLLSENQQSLAEYLSVVQLKEVLQKHCKPIKNDAVWQEISQNLRQNSQKQKTESKLRMLSLTLAASFVVSVAMVGINNLTKQQNTLNASEIPTIASSLAPMGQGGEGPSSQLKHWIHGIFSNLHLQTNIDSLKVYSVDSGTLKGKRVVRFNLYDDKGPLKLIVVEGIQAIKGDGEIAQDSRFSYRELNHQNYVIGIKGSYAILLTGDRSKEDLKEIAGQLMAP
jgi:hypothetical protein